MSIKSIASNTLSTTLILAVVLLTAALLLFPQKSYAAEESGSVGLEGTVKGDPPKVAATITFPSNGQTFTQLPITVTGICPRDTLVKLFKNNVFAGSQQCATGSYSIVSDLFSGENELVARVYDALDQQGPDSNIVRVTFNDSTRFQAGPRVSLSSNFAKRGANPGQKLEWPISISGGSGPYAVSVDWGDGKTPDLLSQAFPGTFVVSHTYDSPGVYNVVVKATDSTGAAAFLQLVGVANGPLSQNNAGGGNDQNKDGTTQVRTRTLWWPALAMVPLIFMTFWIGRRHELYTLRKKLERSGRF